MNVRSRLIPAATLALAIGASAAGAATASATTTSHGGSGSGTSTGTDKSGLKPVCRIVLGGGVLGKGPVTKPGAPDGSTTLKPETSPAGAILGRILGEVSGVVSGKVPGDLRAEVQGDVQGDVSGKVPGSVQGKLPGKGEIVVKPGGGQLPECAKPVLVTNLDTVATELGVSKTALLQALKETGQWAATSATKPSPTQFDQHLADLLHVSAAKIASTLGTGRHVVIKNGS